MISLKYTCALLAGMVLAVMAFSAGVETVSPLAADDDPFAVFADQAAAAADLAEVQRFDDGLKLAGGAFVECPQQPVPRSVVVDRTQVRVRPVCVTRTITICRSGWWTRGPVRRVISFPVRALIGARRR